MTQKPYLSTAELTELTPWSEDAIEHMIAKGWLVEGEHFFRPLGGRRRIWRWDRIVDVIERGVNDSPVGADGIDPIPMRAGGYLGEKPLREKEEVRGRTH